CANKPKCEIQIEVDSAGLDEPRVRNVPKNEDARRARTANDISGGRFALKLVERPAQIPQSRSVAFENGGYTIRMPIYVTEVVPHCGATRDVLLDSIGRNTHREHVEKPCVEECSGGCIPYDHSIRVPLHGRLRISWCDYPGTADFLEIRINLTQKAL